MAAVVGDKIYVIGGVSLLPGSTETALGFGSPQASVGTVEEYDPEKNTWRERSPMPTPRNHTTAGVVDGKIYVIGGRVGAAFISEATDIAVVEEYDPATDKWSSPRSRMPTARSALGSGVYNGRIYVAGGEFQDPHMMATFKAVEAYDPVSDSWSIMPSMPVSRHVASRRESLGRQQVHSGREETCNRLARSELTSPQPRSDALVFP